ncbi:HmuU protein [Afipia carboxidovorans OM5]|uniref:ABC transporter permease protein n=1 Tax=Afipia carboxidovorans (strain ATCC 49405 / DSM 1227 / KCTC 32145 / OM5) TaxID=504832 RepID=B6JBX3_AFIC5|nr:iron ABC transporter permease [Afipia carboxidovorans]ACI92189.1 HmuU protein [Afipia carboxidovorans OM5]AEI04019.1 ABC transporter permease protein [Afipia carboxidovorans OM4]AEI07597.1 ABC transporter permease protein [Afipia carboxidovorans OM5]
MRTATILFTLTALLIAVALVAAGIGPYPIPPQTVVEALWQRLVGGDIQSTIDTVLFNIRLPRIVAAGFVGAALAAAGAAYQSLFRNPLVSPDILGVSTGAGFGAVVGILLGFPVAMIQFLGFAGGLATVAIVVTLARALRSSGDVLVLVLAGIVVGALAGAAISLVKVLADPYDQLPAITFWLLGSLSGIKAHDVAATVPVVLIGLGPLILLRWRIGVLSLGDDEARALGVEVGRLRAIVIAAATLVTASVVAISGVIGWVGLMVPHMARLLIGPRFDRLLPAAILLGAAFMIGVDTLARSAARIEIPLGVLTAIIGGPVFVWLLAHNQRRLLP